MGQPTARPQQGEAVPEQRAATAAVPIHLKVEVAGVYENDTVVLNVCAKWRQ